MENKALAKQDPFEFFAPDLSSPQMLNFYLSSVQAGLPSHASDYEDGKLDLNSYVIDNPTSTFFLRVAGHSMTGVGLQDGDVVVVDKSLDPQPGKQVIAILDGEFTVKTFSKDKMGRVILKAENPDYPHIYPSSEQEFQIWGVVMAVIHKL